MTREIQIKITEEDGHFWVSIHGDLYGEQLSEVQKMSTESEAIGQAKWALQYFSGAGTRRRHRYGK